MATPKPSTRRAWAYTALWILVGFLVAYYGMGAFYWLLSDTPASLGDWLLNGPF